MEERGAIISMLILFLVFFAPHIDRMLYILHQDYCISPQTCCSVPVEVALPGMLLTGDSAREFVSEDEVLGCNLRSLLIYLAVATKTFCLVRSAIKTICLSRKAAGLHEKSGSNCIIDFSFQF